MSVLIKGMDMPKNCKECKLKGEGSDSFYTWSCPFTGFEYTRYDCVNDRLDDCPLIEIPTPHGVLKDTTAFDERIRDQYCKKCERRFGIKNGKRKEVYEIGGVPCRACDIGDMLDWLDDAETVIKAEGSET